MPTRQFPKGWRLTLVQREEGWTATVTCQEEVLASAWSAVRQAAIDAAFTQALPKPVKVGDAVRFINVKGEVVEDIVRSVFMQEMLLEPYARNEYRPAVVLTQHSWVYLDDLIQSEVSV